LAACSCCGCSNSFRIYCFRAKTDFRGQTHHLVSKLGRQFGLLKYLCYSHSFLKRMKWNWSLSGNMFPDNYRGAGNEDLVVTLTEERFGGKQYSAKRSVDGQFRSDEDLFIEILARISSDYVMMGRSEVIKFTGDVAYIEALMRIEIGIPGNQVGGFSLFPCIRIPQERQLPIEPKNLILAFRAWDVAYFYRAFNMSLTPIEWMAVWKELRRGTKVVSPGASWETTGYYGGHYPPPGSDKSNVPPLMIYLVKNLSWTNRAFAGDSKGPYSMHTLTNLYPEKMVKLVEKFNKPTRIITDPMKSLSPYFPLAYELLYYAIGTAKHFRSQTWDFNDALDNSVNKVSKRTAAGLRAGPRFTYKKNGISTTASVTGKKMEQLPYAINEIHKVREKFLDDPTFTPQDCAAQVTLKDEVFNKDGLPTVEADELHSKVRPFYILSLFQYLMASMVESFRQVVERGRVIKIGMSFWYGGALAFGMQMGYDDPDIVFEDGDFRHLDTTLHMILLMIYVVQASIYYDIKNMTSDNAKLFSCFLRVSAERLSIKVTHLFGTIWRVVYGGMPSGAYETSHGDSWIIAFLYYLFIALVVHRHPSRRKQIMQLLKYRRIGICVYGDDHITFTHKHVFDIINLKLFSDFCYNYWGMTIRDIHTRPFFTKPNNRTGLVDSAGIVFLKRYFVKREDVYTPEEIIHYGVTASVLPYRPLNAVVLKYAYGKGDSKSCIEYIVSAIGLAYDTHGTNRVAYDFCKHMYDSLSLDFYGNVEFEIERFMNEEVAEGRDTYVTRLMRTAGITNGDIVLGFPSWEMLARRHNYDSDYVDFGGAPDPQQYETW